MAVGVQELKETVRTRGRDPQAAPGQRIGRDFDTVARTRDAGLDQAEIAVSQHRHASSRALPQEPPIVVQNFGRSPRDNRGSLIRAKSELRRVRRPRHR